MLITFSCCTSVPLIVPLYGLDRVINKVAVETGFPCIPTIKQSDGRGGGHLFEGGRCLFDIACLLDGGH